MIFITGDTHGGENRDLEKLNSKNFSQYYLKNINFNFTSNNIKKPLSNNFGNREIKIYKDGSIDVYMDKNKDFIIILGDFGLIWSNKGDRYYKTEQFHLKNLANKRYTTLFIDGNHDNHDKLNSLPLIGKFGGKVGLAYNDKNGEIHHLRRGEVYTINGQTFLCLGGAETYNSKEYKEGKNWWKNEALKFKDIKNCLKNLKKYNYKIDYILTHNAPSLVGKELIKKYAKSKDLELLFTSKSEDKHARFFQRLIDKYNIEFKFWYFGHYHIDDKITLNDKTYCGLYNQVLKIQ